MNIELLLHQSKYIQIIGLEMHISELYILQRERVSLLNPMSVRSMELLLLCTCAATQHVRGNEKYVWCNESLLLIIFVLIYMFYFNHNV